MCPEPDLSDDILCDHSQALNSAPAQRINPLATPEKSPHNGTNGGAAKNDSEPAETKKDDWPEMGMQIIQSVLRDAQSKATAVHTEAASEEISDLPPMIEELRKKILEGIVPDFRVAPKNGQPLNGSSFTPESQSELAPPANPARESDDSSAPLAPDLLSSMMDELRKQIGEDPPAPVSPAAADVERARTWMSALVPAPNATLPTTTPNLLSPSVVDLRKPPAEDMRDGSQKASLHSPHSNSVIFPAAGCCTPSSGMKSQCSVSSCSSHMACRRSARRN